MKKSNKLKEKKMEIGLHTKKDSTKDVKNVDMEREKTKEKLQEELIKQYENFRKEEYNKKIKQYYGTGKTHISMAICNELLKNNVPIIFGTLTQLVEKYAICYKNHTESELTKLYTKVDLLVIDDLVVEPMNDWLLSKLFVIINEIIINELPFIITTNYDMEALKND